MSGADQEELAERVARAISAWRWDQKTEECWERLKPAVQAAYRDQAKAAIAAVSEHKGAKQPVELSTWLREIASRIDSLSYSLNDGCLGDIASEIEAKAESLLKRESAQPVQECREAFEQYWLRSMEILPGKSLPYKTTQFGGYGNSDMQFAWIGWRAAWELKRELVDLHNAQLEDIGGAILKAKNEFEADATIPHYARHLGLRAVEAILRHADLIRRKAPEEKP